MQIIHENEYEEIMKNIVTPYLLSHRRELYVPGADYPFRNESKRITGKIHMLQYLSDIDMPKGVVVISHGFTESAVKYDEVAYYFLKEGYHVYIPEHCGHGRSYRLTADPSLVHIDTWRRYIRDFLKACRYIKKAHPDLSLNLYAHSMGGAIGGIAAAWEPDWFHKVILSSPMIRPLTDNVPWPAATGIALEKCIFGKDEEYVAGRKPYDGSGSFETSSATSKPRYERYKNLRAEHEELQTWSPSYGWLWASAEMSWYLRLYGWKKYTAPMLLIQAQTEDMVSVRALKNFAGKINRQGKTTCDYIHMIGTKHEIYGSRGKILEKYWGYIFTFLDDTENDADHR